MTGEILTLFSQIAGDLEATPGTAETLTNADVRARVIEPDYSLEPISQERDLVRDAFSMHPDLYAGTTTNRSSLVTFTFGVELAGHVSGVGSAPPVGKFLQACGFEEVTGANHLTATIGAITGGPFLHGETISSSGGGGTTSTVMGDTWTGGTRLLMKLDGTAPSTGTLTGGTSGATAVASAVTTDIGTTWQLVSAIASQQTITIGLYKDGKFISGRGCMGNLTSVTQRGERQVVNFTFTGILNDISDTALLTGMNYTSSVPPVATGVSLVIDDDTTTWSSAKLTNISIDLGNSVALREDVNAADGICPAIINGRAPTGSMDPDLVLEATYPVLENFVNGVVARATWTVGSATGNRFDWKLPAIQASGVGSGIRDEVRTTDISFKCTGGLFNGGGSDEVGVNNEVILTNY